MSDERPMHAVPGLFQRLLQIYASGEQAVEEGRFADAVALFSEGIALDDHFRQRYVTMYSHRAIALHRLGKHREAIADYEKAIEMEPPNHQAQYHFQAGMCRSALGQFEAAVEGYGKAISFQVGHPGPFHLRGKVLTQKLHRHQEAIADFDVFLQGREDPEVFELRGNAKLELDRPLEAIDDLSRANRMEPTAYRSYLLATAAARTQNVDLGLDAITSALSADPSYAKYFDEDPVFAPLRQSPKYSGIRASIKPH